ncbi:MAG: helix-turn-helix transcriptional regulator [Sedimentisphaerales bacterium]
MDDSQWLFVRKSFRMSPRELDIAKRVCSGFSNDEIASRLGIRIATVKTHLRNIYRRIRVQRKLDMLLTFLEKGSKYANPASGITMAVVKSKAASNSGRNRRLKSDCRPLCGPNSCLPYPSSSSEIALGTHRHFLAASSPKIQFLN